VWQIEKEVLKRVQSTPAQTNLNRRQRLINIKQAFGVNNGSSIQDKAVLLVDDVYTTGATATECAKTLLKNGAASVDVLTLARTL
jgi:predicted amidophosphoribosyltransferase